MDGPDQDVLAAGGPAAGRGLDPDGVVTQGQVWKRDLGGCKGRGSSGGRCRQAKGGSRDFVGNLIGGGQGGTKAPQPQDRMVRRQVLVGERRIHEEWQADGNGGCPVTGPHQLVHRARRGSPGGEVVRQVELDRCLAIRVRPHEPKEQRVLEVGARTVVAAAAGRIAATTTVQLWRTMRPAGIHDP